MAEVEGIPSGRRVKKCPKGARGIVSKRGTLNVIFAVGGKKYITSNKQVKLAAPVPEGQTVLEQTVPSALMAQMWTSRASSGDVRLLPVGSAGVPAHACVLGAASPVFRAALQSGMKEASAREISIPDVTEDVVTGVLQILYMNEMPGDLDKMSALAFIHKYLIAEAARFVAPKVVSEMTADTAPNVVRFLRDFEGTDNSGRQLLDLALDKAKGDRKMLKRCFQLL